MPLRAQAPGSGGKPAEEGKAGQEDEEEFVGLLPEEDEEVRVAALLLCCFAALRRVLRPIVLSRQAPLFNFDTTDACHIHIRVPTSPPPSDPRQLL